MPDEERPSIGEDRGRAALAVLTDHLGDVGGEVVYGSGVFMISAPDEVLRVPDARPQLLLRVLRGIHPLVRQREMPLRRAQEPAQVGDRHDAVDMPEIQRDLYTEVLVKAVT